MWKWLKSHRWVLLIVAVLIVGGWFIFGRKKVQYDEFRVEKRNIRETLELSGEITATQQATLRFGAGGLVTFLGAQEGDEVKKWQTLASIDSRQLQKVLEQKLNLYAIQRGTFEQTIDDNDNSVPAGDLARTLSRLLEKNQYQLENTVKDVEYQDLSIKLSRIYTPINGILVHSPITVPNVQVVPTDVWTVVDPNSLEFVADLDETDLSRLSIGQVAEISLDAYPADTISSTIKSISYTPTETSTGTTYQAKFPLPKDVLTKLRLGLNGNAAVIIQEKGDVLTLPSSAITVRNGSSFVLVKDDNKYVEREIETGMESEGYVEIISGASEGERVYTSE